MKLTEPQIKALKKLSELEEECAFVLGVTMNTMYALRERGLIKRSNPNELYWQGWESTGIYWMLTEEGAKIVSPKDGGKQTQ